MNVNRNVGMLGEEFATLYLVDHGFTILKRNATSRWGELDIVAEKERKLYFFEVKTRISTRQGSPYEAVEYFKVKKLLRTIQYFILANKMEKRKMQLDVISVELNSDYTLKKLKRYEDVKMPI